MPACVSCGELASTWSCRDLPPATCSSSRGSTTTPSPSSFLGGPSAVYISAAHVWSTQHMVLMSPDSPPTFTLPTPGPTSHCKLTHTHLCSPVPPSTHPPTPTPTRPSQSAREALKAQLRADPDFRKELRGRVKEALLSKAPTKSASYNFDSYMLTGGGRVEFSFFGGGERAHGGGRGAVVQCC